MFNEKPVYIVDGCRTPFLKYQSKLGPGKFSASELAVQNTKSLLLRQNFESSLIDEVILGCTTPSENEMNIARVVALRSGLSVSTPAWTVHRNCASGLQAIDSSIQAILTGKSKIILCGGVDALSHAPFLFSKMAVKWFTQLSSSKKIPEKLKKLTEFRPSFFSPIAAILKGLTDPVEGISMGQTAENLVKKFGIERDLIDEFAKTSHMRAAEFKETIHSAQLCTIYDKAGNAYHNDDGIREDISLEKLRTLKPVFDKPDGNITAGNSSQISDGSSLLILCSEDTLKTLKIEPLAEISQVNWAGIDPNEMGLGPIHAFMPILKNKNLKKDDIDIWEINEAFSAQVLACQKALTDKNYCQNNLQTTKAFGEIAAKQLNIAGGAIALGHPVAASGPRIVLNLVHLLKHRKKTNGIASICIGGGMGGATHIKLC